MNNTPGVIIRLQRLPWEAASADVRQFFRGLNIPDGGVHIVGGRDGDAFIAFASDEDARQAMRRDGEKIKDAKVKLFLSSRIEMQQVIDKARMELQQSMNQHVLAGEGRDRASHSGKRRRSRSGDRHRRSRSRSWDRNRSRGAGGNQQTRNDSAQPPPLTPTMPISGFSSFRNEPLDAGSRYNQSGRGVLDRSGPPLANVDGRYLDRGPPPPKPSNFPSPRSQELSSFPLQSGSGLAGFAASQSNKPASSGNVRAPTDRGDAFAGPTQLIRPGGIVPPPFMPGGKAKFNEPPAFAGAGVRGRPEQRYEAVLDAGPPKPSPTHLDPNSPFGVQQQLGPPQSNRAPRRALLPAPEEMAEPVPDFGGDRQPRSFDGPIPGLFPPSNLNTGVDTQQRPPQPLLPARPNLPLVDQATPNDWPMEGNLHQQPGVGFPFGLAPHGRPTLLLPPKSDIGLSILMTAVPTPLQRYGAIREFFHPLDLEGPDKIKIAVDEHGQRTGQVYCKFLNAEDAERALTYTGREAIYIRSCTDEEFEKAVDGGLARPRSNSRERDSEAGSHRSHRDDSRSRSIGNDSGQATGTDFVIEVTNIPYKAVQRDLRYMFGRFNPLEIRRLYKHHHANGKIVTSDTAFVIFENESDALAALRTRDRRLLDRELRLTRCSMASMEDTFTRAPPAPPEAVAEWMIRDSRDRHYQENRQGRVDRPMSRSPPRRVLSPQLPYQIPSAPYERPPIFKPGAAREPSPVGVSTPVSSFSRTCVCVKGVAMNATNRDVASFFVGLNIASNGIRILKATPGVAYVEFATPNDCEQALKKDRSYIGTQMVTVRPCSREEMMEAVHKQFGLNGGGGGNSPQTQPAPTGPTAAQNIPLFEDQSAEPLQQPNDFARNADQADLLYLQQLAALAKQQEESNSSGNTSVAGKTQNDLNQVELTPGGSATFSSADLVLSDMPPIDPEVVCNIGVPGCVAALHNLPPRITLEEICQLFQGYQLIDDSIRMHYSNTGEPTGDCLLAFATARDAEVAVANLNGTAIDGQVVKMYVVPV